MTAAGAPLRLFFALWPDDAVRAALARWSLAIQRIAGGRVTRTESIHLTVAFLGAIEPARLEELKAVAASVAVSPFELVLDAAGCWKHNRIAWAGATAAPPALEALVSDLRAALAGAGFRFDPKPFVSHLTLVRKARPGFTLPALERVPWRVTGFVLVRSVMQTAGSVYRVESRWG